MVKNKVALNRLKFKENLYNLDLMVKNTELNLKIILQLFKNNFKIFKTNFKELWILQGVNE
jgi:CRISPR/Cas system CSM-associated protein Csm3 (group 7 of RAMP superfamily)